MSSVEDFPAKISVSQEKEQDSPGTEAASGSNSSGSSKKSARRGSSSKTSQPFALADWSKCSGASLRSGTMQNGTVYPLPPLVPLTKETGSGLWRTPNARVSGGGEYKDPAKILKRWEAGHQVNLSEQVRLWPTPCAHEGRLGYQRRDTGKKGTQKSLTTLVIDSLGGRGTTTGQLNPTWVEWLMGFPSGWTDLGN